MTGDFAGKVALVTGAGSGIGRATAVRLARGGAAIVGCDLDEVGMAETRRLVEATGGTATLVRADVTRADEVEALVRRATAAHGTLDVAVNNAGVEGDLALTAAYPLETWDRVIAVNLTGVFLCLRAELAVMERQGSGAIVNMASAAGLVGLPRNAAYTASKHGVVGMTKSAAAEYADRGIRVNAVCPGWTETPMVMDRGLNAAGNPATRAWLLRTLPIRRLGTPDEIAEAVAWLASDAASFVTGHALAVDGGIAAV